LGFDPKNPARKTVDGHHLLSLPKPGGLKKSGSNLASPALSPRLAFGVAGYARRLQHLTSGL